MTSEHPAAGLTVRTLETPSLGDRSYVVHDGEVAFVVDPQRDVDRVLEVLADDGVRLTHVFETHIHNDYVTGGLALARATGAAYLVNSEDQVSFDRTPIADGEVVEVGDRMRVRAIATPGHTFTHLSYALSDREEPYAVFTGGSLLYGATGRPDLLGAEHTDALVRHQHASAHRLAAELPDEADVYPTHGFGSFCSATQSDATASTIGGGEAVQPGADPGRGDLRPRAARRAGCLAGLLRAHEPGERRRPVGAGPVPGRGGRRHRAAAPDRGRRVGRRPAQPDGVRGRSRAGHPQLRPRRGVLHLPGVAHRVGHPGDPAW
ncbi:MBL fold metallo-hydrolase [Nocardioides sp. TF02-7]|nr:MBL fold metallo-hydrolase [Nocardioides sp. TF02-7]UMG91620.1 MBL fold metallo-hydrolase [Nocardioides sp. TF02-7]